MNQIVYEIVVFLHLMGYHDTKLKLLTNMYKNKLEIENEAIIQIINDVIVDLKKRNAHESIIANLDNYINIINNESQY
ncbi:MAG: hypothetical protein BZ133_00250 [Methanosphaera sp. SHI613]|nr:MAG: hypothetical protein BZ133_00250 [Methanosphaera sp. SHI613]